MRAISLAIVFLVLGCASSEPTASSAGGTGGDGGDGGAPGSGGGATSSSSGAGGGGAGGQGGQGGAGGAGGAGGQGGGCELACQPMPLGTFIQIDIYEWKGEMVYLTLGDCCDQYDSLFTSACEPICAPSGGKTGTGDGKCPTFYDEAVFVCTAWKKP